MPASTTVDARRPIDIADRKQLFIDSRFFSRSSGIGLWMPPPAAERAILEERDRVVKASRDRRHQVSLIADTSI